jgi:hypothetical protein
VVAQSECLSLLEFKAWDLPLRKCALCYISTWTEVLQQHKANDVLCTPDQKDKNYILYDGPKFILEQSELGSIHGMLKK